MKFKDINKSMNYLTKRYGSNEKNIATNLFGLISFSKTASISEENREKLLETIRDEIKYGLDLTDEQKNILLAEIENSHEKEEVRSFRI